MTLTPTQTGINAKATTGFGNAILVKGFATATYSFGTASSADMTVKIQGATGDTAPDFTAAASATNRWSYIDFGILNNAGLITDGDTGIIWTGTDYETSASVNYDNLDWLCLQITARAAGTLTATLALSE